MREDEIETFLRERIRAVRECQGERAGELTGEFVVLPCVDAPVRLPRTP